MRRIILGIFFLVVMASLVFPAYAEKGKIRACLAKYKGMHEGIGCCYEHHQKAIKECQEDCKETKCSFRSCETVSFDMDCGPVIRKT